MANQPKISNAIIRRLPRYRRYLGHLQKNGVKKISSNELSEIIGYTASQIRQDLNTFGEFGQQGYGYEVDKLYKEINKILGLDREYRTVIVGIGNLGSAITKYTYYCKIGFNIIGLFDVSQNVIGNRINGIEVQDRKNLVDFIKSENVDIGIICVDRENAQAVADDMIKGGIKGIWNFAPIDLEVPADIALESVHLSDSLHALSFLMKQKNGEAESKFARENK